MDRRQFTLALGAMLGAPVLAYAAPGPFLDYTQDALDKAYDQSNWAPNAREVVARYASDSAAVRRRYPPSTQRYGVTDAETLDIFAPAGAGRLPVMVFMHGGAWRALGKDDASGAAPTFVENGCIYVALNYANIPAVRVPDMAAQCRDALLWVYRNIEKFGGDPTRIFVSGHSSGGHLCAVMLTTAWENFGAPADLIKGGVTLSGMYELYPVLLSARSSYVKITPAEIIALSPLRHMDQLNCPVIVVNGERESPEFLRQGSEFATVLSGMGRLSGHFVLPAKNHFEVPETLYDAHADLSLAVLDMINARR